MFEQFFSDQKKHFWRFYGDTKIFFGRHETLPIFQKAVHFYGRRVGVLTDDTVDKFHFTREYLSQIADSVLCKKHIGFEGNYGDIRNAVRAFRRKKINVIVAIGGGSVIDGGKAVSVLLRNRLDFFQTRKPEVLTNPKVPFIAVPTTFGTGSEVNMYVFLNDAENGKKISIKRDFFCPNVAIINPNIAKETPEKIKYVNGLEAFIHALEVLSLSREKSLIQEALMVRAAHLFLENFRPYIKKPSEANEAAIATVSVLAGVGINNSRPALIHTLAKGLDRYYAFSHPISLIPFIVPVLKLNWKPMRQYFSRMPFEAFHQELTRKVFFDPVLELRGLRASEQEIHGMVTACMKDTVIFKENPIRLNKVILTRLYREAFSRIPEVTT